VSDARFVERTDYVRGAETFPRKRLVRNFTSR
jgi:hypothetical protein